MEIKSARWARLPPPGVATSLPLPIPLPYPFFFFFFFFFFFESGLLLLARMTDKVLQVDLIEAVYSLFYSVQAPVQRPSDLSHDGCRRNASSGITATATEQF